MSCYEFPRRIVRLHKIRELGIILALMLSNSSISSLNSFSKFTNTVSKCLFLHDRTYSENVRKDNFFVDRRVSSAIFISSTEPLPGNMFFASMP